MSEPPLKVAVIGVGSLGQHHARVYSGLPDARLVGVLDHNQDRAAEVAARFDCRVFDRLDQMVEEVDAVSVAVPTVDHHPVARRLLEAGRAVLVEKPITTTLQEADDLIALARERGAVLQVGHIERFNPATDMLRTAAERPRFIEVHRLGSFSARSLDIDVVLDLMIHDLDIVLALDGSEPVQVDAVGVPVLTAKVDIANARLRFASGLIANLTASRVSSEKTRKFRIFAPQIYISADLASRTAQVHRLGVGPSGQPEISVERSPAAPEEPLVRQLAAFLRAARGSEPPAVTGADGRRALALAHVILERIGTPGPTGRPA
jgi:predicted dehydrogenase